MAKSQLIQRDERGHFLKGGPGGPGRKPKDPAQRVDRMYLAGAIRDMLEQELDEQTGMPKMLELIHQAYIRARGGDSDMMKLLFERGYGKTPPVYQLDPRVMLEQLCAQHNLTIEDVKSDPIASYFFGLLDSPGSGPDGIDEATGADAGGERISAAQPILESD